MYRTKGKIYGYSFGNGEKCEVQSQKVIPWNKETDDWYELTEEEKWASYDTTCARMAVEQHFENLLPTLPLFEGSKILQNKRHIFHYLPREDFHLQNPELVMVFHEGETDRHRFLALWVSLDDLEKSGQEE